MLKKWCMPTTKDAFSPKAKSIMFYISCSIFLNLYNKWMMGHFKFPIFTIMTQMFINSILAGAVVWLRLRVSQCRRCWNLEWIFPGWRWYFKHIGPLGFFIGADVALTTYAFTYSSVSMVEVVKAGNIILLILTSFVRGQEQFTVARLGVGCMIALGTCLTTLTEVDFDKGGFVAAVLSSLCSVANMLTSEWVMHSEWQHSRSYMAVMGQDEDDLVVDSDDEDTAPATTIASKYKLDATVTLFFFAPVCVAVLLPVFLYMEMAPLRSVEFTPEVFGRIFLGALVAFLLQVSEMNLAQTVSAVTRGVAGAAKLLVLVLISSIIFSHKMGLMNTIGVLLTSIGVFGYNYDKKTLSSADLLRRKHSTRGAIKYGRVITSFAGDEDSSEDLDLDDLNM